MKYFDRKTQHLYLQIASIALLFLCLFEIGCSNPSAAEDKEKTMQDHRFE